MIRKRKTSKEGVSKEKKWLLDRIEAFEAKFRSICVASQDALILFGPETYILEFNPKAEQMFGWKRQDILGKLVERIIFEKHHLKFYNRIAQFVEQRPSAKLLKPFPIKMVRRDGTVFPAELTISGFADKGKWTFTVFIRDLSESFKYQNAIQAGEEKFNLILHSTTEGIFGLDLDGNCTFANPACLKLLGISDVGDILGKNMHVLTHHTHSDGTLYHGEDCRINLARRLGVKVHSDDEVFWRKDGSSFNVEYRAYPMKRGQEIAGCVVTFLDITERKKTQSALEEQSLRDPLTGLYHRRFFNERLKEEISRAERVSTALAVILCDMKDFKAFNRTWGHETGDKMLIEVGRHMRGFTRGGDIIFKWGGDEFGIVLPHSNRTGALASSKRIRKEIQNLGRKNKYSLDARFGIALYPEHGNNPNNIIEVADQALFIAKKSGSPFHVGIEEYQLNEQVVRVVFQPIVNIRTSETLGEEALSRDAKGKLGIIEFFKKYDSLGLLNSLKCLCFQLQLKEAQKWGLKRIFLNVDSNMLGQLPLEPKPEGLEVVLEISELEALRNIEEYLSIARKWRDQGYQFAIDDFGAGFVSLPFLAHLFPDYIKIDRSTLLQAVSNDKFKIFLKDLLATLRNYSSEGIIAEGVETEDELEVLKVLGIPFGQGFHFGRPRSFNGSCLNSTVGK